jgi:hypothetical protein
VKEEEEEEVRDLRTAKRPFCGFEPKRNVKTEKSLAVPSREMTAKKGRGDSGQEHGRWARQKLDGYFSRLKRSWGSQKRNSSLLTVQRDG